MAEQEKAPSDEVGATWHIWAARVLVAVIICAGLWMVFKPAPAPAPPILVFDADLVFERLAEKSEAGSDPFIDRARVLAAIKEEADYIAETTGSIVLQRNAALAVPAGLDITEAIYQASKNRFAGSDR